MADIESNIRFGVDTSDAIASIKALQAQISAFQKQMASSSVANAESARKLRRGLIDDLNATGQWSASIKTIKSTSDSFTNALEKNKLSMGEYFRYAASQTTTFRGLFSKEFNTIEKTARERVKDLQTQYISLGRDANGALKAIAVRPLRLDMESLATQTAMNAQRQQIFNQLLKQGSTNLLNFGKNTQWAGRQLMVGFTIPLSIFGSMASQTFMQLEEQAIRFKRVYGELFTPPEEADQMLETLKELGKEFTKYGVAVEKTLGLAADAAAMGKTGTDLLDQVTEANRLAVLGSVDQQQALETTISLTNAFGIASEDLAKKIDFLNAVENQTVVSIEDLTIAVPKAGPVVQQLGGDVEDLAFFLTAMKEGGINASEGANALKSGLASLINPTDQAANMLKVFGINVRELVAASRGDVKKLVIDFATALDTLDPSQRAQAIEQLFGKFQFSRLSTLFQNVIQEGTQASRVLELANATTQELAQLSSKELKRVEESTTFRFRKAIEEFQLAIAPVGEEFLKLITPIIEFATKIIERFNSLSEGAKSFITGLIVLLGAVGPVALMTFGLLANGIANIIKGFTFVRELFQRTGNQSNVLGQQFDYLTTEQLQASAVAASLDQVHQKLIQTFSSEAGAVNNLANVYKRAYVEQQRFDTGRRIAGQPGMKLASGIVSVPGPKGAGDVVPAMLSPGEAVIPADAAKKYAPLIQGMIADNIPGFARGKSDKVSLYGGSTTMTSGGGVPFALGNAANAVIGMSEKFFASSDFNKMFSAGAIGAAFRTNEPKGTKMTVEKLNAYLQESGDDLNNIVETLRSSEKELRSANKNIKSFDDITENAKTRLEKIFSGMEQKGGRAAAVGRAVKNEMLMPTAESIMQSKLSETRARAVKGSPSTGKLKETVFRMTGTRGMTAGTSAAQLMYPEEVSRLLSQGTTSFAHLNEKRVGGPVLPFRGGMLASEDIAMKQQAQAMLQAASAKQAAKYPQGVLVNRAEVQKSAQETAKVFNDELEQKLKDPYVAGRDRNSPHRLAASDGRDDAIAYQNSFNDQIKKSRRVRGQVVDGKTIITNPNAITTNVDAAVTSRGPRRVIRPGDKEVREAALKSAEATNNQTRAMNVLTPRLRQHIGILSNATFALSSLSGILTLFGGQFSELSGQIFIVTTAIFGLLQIINVFQESMIVAAAASRFSAAQEAIKTAAAAGGAAAATGFTGAVARAAIGVTAFLGPIGWVVAGLTALAAVITLMISQEEETKKRIAGLGDAAFLSSEKMKKASDLLGFTAKTTQFGQNIVAGTAAGRTADEAGLIQTLRGNEDFKSSFATEIEALKNASREDAQLVLRSAANQLFAAGATKEQVDAYVRALAQEAGQTSLSFSFTNIDFAEGGKDAIIKAAQDASNTFSETFEKGLSATNQTVAKGAVGVFASSFQALKDGLANNIMSAEDFNTGLAEVTSSLEGLSSQELDFVLPNLYEMLGLKETMEGIPNVQDQILLLKADAAGISITEDQRKALQNSEKSAKAAAAALRVRRQIGDQLKVQATQQEENNKLLQEENLINEAIGAATAQLNDRIVALENQSAAYQILIDQGYDAETAFELAGDAALAAGIKSAFAAGIASEEWENLEDFLNRFLEAERKAPKGPSGGGEKSKYEQAIESLKEQRAEITNNAVAFTRLRKAGFDVAAAAEAAKDPLLAAAVASSKVDTEKWRELLGLINNVTKLTFRQQQQELLREGKINRERTMTFAKMSGALQKMGLESEDIQSLLADETWSKAFSEDFMKDGVINSQLVLQKIQQIKKQKAADFVLNIQTKEGAAEEFQKNYDKVVGSLEADKKVIEVKFQIATEQDQLIAREAENLIATIQNEIDNYEAELTGIEEQEELINEKYNDRKEALDKISKSNDSIARQQKNQLTLADALSQGDISAAARAVQEIRAQQAQDRLTKQGDLLEISKEKELGALRSSNGRSRKQIEEAIKKLKKDIFTIEEQTLEPARERIRLATVEKERALDSLNSQILKWEELSALVNQAKLKLTDEEKKAMEDQAKLIKDLLANWDKIEDKEAFLKITKVTTDDTQPATAVTTPVVSKGDGGGGGGGGIIEDTQQAELIDGLKQFYGQNIAGLINNLDSQARAAKIITDRAASTAKFEASGLTAAGFIKKTDSIAEKNAKTAKAVAESTAKFKSTGLNLSAYMRKSGGGMIKRYAAGGFAMGTDTVPAMLTPGEFVVRKYAVDNFGVDRLKAINSGTYNGDSVYNYGINVNVQTDANPDQIARAVIGQIKQIESQRIRGNRF